MKTEKQLKNEKISFESCSHKIFAFNAKYNEITCQCGAIRKLGK
jgi:hypothetical protein